MSLIKEIFKLNYYLFVILLGFGAGIIGTTSGAILSFFINKKSNRFLSFILEFSAGLMVAVVCFDLLPEAYELGGLDITVTGIIMGVILIILVDNSVKISNLNLKRSNMHMTGLLITISIAMHNLPEGLAIGSSFETSYRLGYNIAVVITMHNIAEGLALAIPLKISRMKNEKILLYALFSGIPMGFGTILGIILGEISYVFIALCLGFAAGAMLYVICGNLIPESKSLYIGRISTIGNILGIILGMIMSLSRI
jgi:ZIP family zinc transporter